MIDKYTLQKEITVEAPREKAFRAFTAGFDRWWPRMHRISKAEMKEAVLEQKLGGRWYEKGVDGSECDWGRFSYGNLRSGFCWHGTLLPTGSMIQTSRQSWK